MRTLEALNMITPEEVLAEYAKVLRSMGKDPAKVPATREQAAAMLERFRSRELVDVR